jgi:hypothetical protein
MSRVSVTEGVGRMRGKLAIGESPSQQFVRS